MAGGIAPPAWCGKATASRATGDPSPKRLPAGSPFGCTGRQSVAKCEKNGTGTRAADMRWIIRIAGFIAVIVVLGLGALVAVPTERVAGLVPTG